MNNRAFRIIAHLHRYESTEQWDICEDVHTRDYLGTRADIFLEGPWAYLYCDAETAEHFKTLAEDETALAPDHVLPCGGIMKDVLILLWTLD